MRKLNSLTTARAFAPASIGNMAVGFDILGLAIAPLGDEVTLCKRSDKKIIITDIESDDEITFACECNTATVALLHACTTYRIHCGFDVQIKKGIPLSSGLGGSAASAVAAVVALNEFLVQPLTLAELATSAIAGETVASGAAHGDNVVPCSYGGFTLIQQLQPIRVVKLPTPDLFCIVVHPELKIKTKVARAILDSTMPLHTFVNQSANLAGFIAACYENNTELMRACLQDVLIEPYRAQLITGFQDVKQAALNHEALGCSISGSGPSIFALAKTKRQAENIRQAMQNAFQQHKINSQAWLCHFNSPAARSINP